MKKEKELKDVAIVLNVNCDRLTLALNFTLWQLKVLNVNICCVFIKKSVYLNNN